MKKLFVGILMVMVMIGFSGCAGMQPKMSPEAKIPLICNGDEQCQLYWDRALFYVSSHSKYKIQTQTDSLIQTYSPINASTNLGYIINKEPLGNNSFRIWIRIWCDNIFGCYPKKNEEIIQFKKYVREGIK